MIQVLVFSDVVNVMAVYQPVCKCVVPDGGSSFLQQVPRLNHNCSFSKARNSSLMMVPPKHVGATVGILVVLIFL
jgi:hypothetical protein